MNPRAPVRVQLLTLVLSTLCGVSALAQQPAAPKRDNEFDARARAVAQGTRRMAPIPEDQWTPDQKTANEIYKAARKNDVKSGLFMDLIRVPDTMEAVFKMQYYVQAKVSFGDELSALAMLITLRQWNQKQEFGGHAAEAVRFGMKPEVVQAIAEGRHPVGLSPDETVIYDFMTELLANHGVSDPSYAYMVKRFGEQGVIEAITLAGLYSMVGMTYNTVREPVPDGYVPLPELPQLKSNPANAYSDLPPRPPGFPAPRPAAPMPTQGSSGQ
jgi:4-carboxymuconolactone decarboxylase